MGTLVVLVTQLCPTLLRPRGLYSPAGSSVLGFPRQEYWSGLPLHSPGDLPDPGIKPVSLGWQADFLPPEPAGKPCAHGWFRVKTFI